MYDPAGPIAVGVAEALADQHDSAVAVGHDLMGVVGVVFLLVLVVGLIRKA